MLTKKSKYAIYYVEPKAEYDELCSESPVEFDDDYRMPKKLFDELSPYYDKNSSEYSLTKQGEIYSDNPHHDLYMRKMFKLPLPMEYRYK